MLSFIILFFHYKKRVHPGSMDCVVCVSRTRFQLVIGRDCMRRPEVNSRCEYATRTESARNFCLKQPEKAFAFSYGDFENSRARGGMRRDCRPCRPKHADRVLWATAQTCKKSMAFENGPEARETPEQRSSARTRAKLEGVYTKKFLISVVNNLG